MIFFREIPAQVCSGCERPLLHEFIPTRSKPLVSARQRARKIAQRGLIELGDASLGTVNSEMDRLHRDHQAAGEAELQKAALGIVEELGGELWTSSPPEGMRS